MRVEGMTCMYCQAHAAGWFKQNAAAAWDASCVRCATEYAWRGSLFCKSATLRGAKMNAYEFATNTSTQERNDRWEFLREFDGEGEWPTCNVVAGTVG